MKRLTLILGKAAGGLVTATATPFVHEGPRRAAENCNCKTFCPRRAAKDGGELQLQDLLSTKGREGRRRTATAGPFVHGGPRRAAETCNCNIFCPRRATKDHEELQLQKGNCRTSTATLFVCEGRRRTATSFVHEGPRRATKNCNCRRATAELQLQKGNFLSAKGGGELQQQDLLSTKGREGPRRATKNCNCRRATAELFCPDVNGSWLSRSHLTSLLLGNLRYWGSFAAYLHWDAC